MSRVVARSVPLPCATLVTRWLPSYTNRVRFPRGSVTEARSPAEEYVNVVTEAAPPGNPGRLIDANRPLLS